MLAVRNQNERSVALTLAFWPRHPAEFEFMREQAPRLHFTERSTLARIGIEMSVGVPTIEKGRLVIEATAFLFDEKGLSD